MVLNTSTLAHRCRRRGVHPIINGGRIVYSYSQLAAAELYDFLADEATDAVWEFAEEELDEHPSLLSGGLLALEVYEQTQPALAFKESTEDFFEKTMTRIQNTLDDYLDPSIPEDQKRSLDLDAVETDLKQYWKDLVDEKIGFPVNSALDFLDNAVKSARVMLGNSDVRARLDIDPVAGGTLPLAAAAGHHDGILGSNNADVISGGDLIDLIYGAAGNDTLRGGTGSDILVGGDGNDFLVGDIGEDILSGGLGNDQLDGGFGYDEMRGGVGDDTFTFNSSADQAIEAASQGIDTILSSVSLSVMPTNVENATLTGFGWNGLTGSSAWNVLTGNSGNWLASSARTPLLAAEAWTRWFMTRSPIPDRHLPPAM
ncbi:calcium-binding protein [Bradyrhizobium sp. sBnM-33]|uniref:calcium-binding protein n=1 Tax=Bradyrhizobium sp. sBnM-33 TaxID=2831780 RepID=UPI001BD19909|nr:calcium-binding protein [Bradyrhizobium sp. sBnM-33]WOH48858.1 calcium-binding protein [Bradyrhizobium sp. sBnM-33]